MFLQRAAGLLLFGGLIAGCQSGSQPRASAQGEPPGEQAGAALAQSWRASHPGTEVGIVNAVLPARHEAQVAGLPVNQMREGDVVSILLNGQGTSTISGRVFDKRYGYVQLDYDSPQAGQRDPRDGDLVVWFVGGAAVPPPPGEPTAAPPTTQETVTAPMPETTAPPTTQEAAPPATQPAAAPEQMPKENAAPPTGAGETGAPATSPTNPPENAAPPSTQPTGAPETQPSGGPTTQPATTEPAAAGGAPPATSETPQAPAPSPPGELNK